MLFLIFLCTFFFKLPRDQDATKNLNFQKIKRGLQNLSGRIFAKSPQTAVEVTAAFQMEEIWNKFGLSKSDDPRPFFKACIKEPDFAYCIFSSEKIINIIKEYIPPSKRKYLVDATFKIVPQGCFKQLLILHVDYFDEKVSMQFLHLVLKYFKFIWVTAARWHPRGCGGGAREPAAHLNAAPRHPTAQRHFLKLQAQSLQHNKESYPCPACRKNVAESIQVFITT